METKKLYYQFNYICYTYSVDLCLHFILNIRRLENNFRDCLTIFMSGMFALNYRLVLILGSKVLY